MNEQLAQLRADLEEIASRGVNHPNGQQLLQRMSVAIDQVQAAAGEPPPPADPVQDQLARLNLGIAALGEAVGPIVQRQQDVAHELGIIGASVVRLTELVGALQTAVESGKPATNGA